MSIYITFDPYYDENTYNSFLTASKNNGVELEEFIRVRAPHHRFIKINSKKDLPTFVNYDFATSNDIKWLVSTVKPVQPNEAYQLKRRPGKDVAYWNYITPKPLIDATDEDYIMVFSAMSFTEMSELSKKMPDTKIYKWGKSEKRKYNIYYCFNPYIRGFISEKNMLMEFGKASVPSQALHHDISVPKIKGDLEFRLNYFVLIKEKLENKTLEAEYWYKGSIHPLKRTAFI